MTRICVATGGRGCENHLVIAISTAVVFLYFPNRLGEMIFFLLFKKQCLSLLKSKAL